LSDLVDLNVIGADRVARNLGAMSNAVKRNLVQAVDKASDAVDQRTTKYPPRRPSSKYRRTGRLGQSWHITRKDGGLSALHRNQARSPKGVFYAPYVQGTKYQAKVHRGRWPTAGMILKELGTKINRFFEAAIEKAVKRG
jgi:hypothetical protein